VMSSNMKKYIALEGVDTNTTIDLWSDTENRSFVGVTVHFISTDWKLESFSIACKHVEGNHNSKNIASWIDKVFDEWSLKPWLRTNDNASNMSKSLTEELKKLNKNVNSLACGAHTLDLTAKNIFIQDKLAPLWKNSKLINAHFNMSSKSTSLLLSVQPQGSKLKPKKMKSFSETRWVDSVRVLKRQYELSVYLEQIWDEVVVNMKNRKEENIPHLPSLKEWNIILAESIVLCVFADAVNKIEGELYPTMPWLLDCVSCCFALCKNEGKLLREILSRQYDVTIPNHDVLFKTLVRFVEKDLKERFFDKWEDAFKEEGNEIMKIPVVAALLSPSTWEMNMFTSEMKFNAKAEMTRLFEAEKTRNEVYEQSQDNSEENLSITKEISLFEQIKQSSKNSKKRKSRNELELYFEMTENTPESNVNCMEWWSMNSSTFPNISKIAKKYLSVPASSAPCERLFSKARRVIGDERRSLNPIMMENQALFSKNFKRVNQLNYQ